MLFRNVYELVLDIHRGFQNCGLTENKVRLF